MHSRKAFVSECLENACRGAAIVDSQASADYIYILSRGHSGSTLLCMLLGAHPEMASMGELQKLSLQFARGDRGRCSCGQRPAECPLWSAVALAIKERFGVDLSQSPFRFRVSATGLEEDRGVRSLRHWLTRKNYRLWRYAALRRIPVLRHASFLSWQRHRWISNRFFVADAVRRLAGTRAVIDASKDYIDARDLCDAGIGTPRVIFMTRDVRGNVWSFKKRQRGTVPAAAKAWVDFNERALCMLDGLRRDAWMQIKYEDLCTDLSAQLRRLYRFLGFQYDSGMINLKEHAYHTIGGNKIRYSALGSVSEDLSWQDNLSSDELRCIDEIAGPMKHKLGY